MKSNPKITIIVPVFNRENSIRRCLSSLINQTLKGIEILVFDDCSTDKSVKVINEYAKEFNQITLIKNKANIGLGAIRNLGVHRARGKYILFVDSDDWIDHNACKILFKIAEQEKLEVIIGRRKMISQRDTNHESSYFKGDIVMSKGVEFLLSNNFLSVVWDKFWLRDFIIRNNLKNLEGRYYEDKMMIIEGLIAAERVTSIEYVFYYNFVGDSNSISRMIPTEKHLEDKIYGLDLLINKLKANKRNMLILFLKKRLVKDLYFGLSIARRYIGNNQKLLNDLIIKIKEALRHTGLTILFLKSIPIFNRILVVISPEAYLKISRIIDKLKS